MRRPRNSAGNTPAIRQVTTATGKSRLRCRGAVEPPEAPMTTRSIPSIVRIVCDETPGPEHLAATARCDADHPAIVRLASDLTREAAGPREAAVALFTWVRDEILYTMG